MLGRLSGTVTEAEDDGVSGSGEVAALVVRLACATQRTGSSMHPTNHIAQHASATGADCNRPILNTMNR